jgi:hypothetical protein
VPSLFYRLLLALLSKYLLKQGLTGKGNSYTIELIKRRKDAKKIEIKKVPHFNKLTVALSRIKL